MGLPNIVKVVNVGTKPFFVRHLQERFDLDPGQYALMPWEGATSSFGDPRARNDGPDRGRQRLYEQLRGMWNFKLGFDTETKEQAEVLRSRGRTDVDSWEELRPEFEVWTVNDPIERIYMVLDDPTGQYGLAATTPDSLSPTPSSDVRVLQGQIEQMQNSIAQLTGLLAMKGGTVDREQVPVREDEEFSANPQDTLAQAKVVDAVIPEAAVDSNTADVDAPQAVRTGKNK